MQACCAGCGERIFDRFLMQVEDKAWHDTCLICADCNVPLSDRCFSRGDKLYCKKDFHRRYGAKCAGCDQTIAINDLVRRANGKVFHVNCFCCTICQKRLDTGDQLYIVNGHKFICQKDYLNSAARLSSSASNCALSECSSDIEDDESIDDVIKKFPKGSAVPRSESVGLNSDVDSQSDVVENSGHQSDEDQSDGQTSTSNAFGPDENSNGPGTTKRRGPRTTIKAKQLETLKAAFAATPKPSRHIREQLAQETGLNMRVIQVWFQNRRSKERRMKQLRYGSFRPGSRRSRAAREENALVHANAAMFQDRNPEFYQSSMSYYCDMFGQGGTIDPSAAGHEVSHLPPPGYMLSGEHIHHEEPQHFLLSDSGLRQQSSPDMPLGAESVFRGQHTTFASLTSIKSEAAALNNGVW